MTIRGARRGGARRATLLHLAAVWLVASSARPGVAAPDQVVRFDFAGGTPVRVPAASVPRPVGGVLSRTLAVVPEGEEGVIVVASRQGCAVPYQPLWRVNADTVRAAVIHFPTLWPDAPLDLSVRSAVSDMALENLMVFGTNEVEGGVAAFESTFLQARFGILKVVEGNCKWAIPESLWWSLSMAADGGGGLWIRAMRIARSRATKPERARTVLVRLSSEYLSGNAEQQAKGVGRYLAYSPELPALAIAGDPLEASAWVYAESQGNERVIYRCAADGGRAIWMQPPPDADDDRIVAPYVDTPILRADRQHHLWLCGDTLAGSKVFLFDGKTLEEHTPPVEFLKGRRFTAVAVDAEDGLHAATDGVGVLVHDSDGWREHPINAHLPTIAGTGLKRVYCLTFDRAGNLWVGMDNNVICWRDEE